MNFINPETLATPKGYNHGVLSNGGRLLFVAGQIGWDRNEKLVDGFAAQFDLALANVLEVVRAAGGNVEDISRFTIFVKDKSEYLKLRKEIGKLYRQRMRHHYPAMSLVVVKDLLEDGALIEIEATAVIP
ncbi:RidA family protein [bacterium]|nr:RidA family protein [bacterium]